MPRWLYADAYHINMHHQIKCHISVHDGIWYEYGFIWRWPHRKDHSFMVILTALRNWAFHCSFPPQKYIKSSTWTRNGVLRFSREYSDISIHNCINLQVLTIMSEMWGGLSMLATVRVGSLVSFSWFLSVNLFDWQPHLWLILGFWNVLQTFNMLL